MRVALFGVYQTLARFAISLGNTNACPSQKEMAPFATLATTITQEHVQKRAARGHGPHDTPVLSLAAEAQSKGYQAICLPLTTAKWRERWQNMCIMPSTGTAGNEEVIAAEKAAEAWRKSPSFLLDEVTITRLGEISPSHRSHSPCVRYATYEREMDR